MSIPALCPLIAGSPRGWNGDRSSWTGLAAPVAITLLGLALSVWASLSVFDRIPHNEDEPAFVFQAKVFERIFRAFRNRS